MYKPDEDIDDLGRKAAEHYNAPGTPSWDALQQVLDKELPQEKEKKRRGFFFFFFLLLGVSVAGTGIWYGLGTGKKQSLATTHNTPNTKNETTDAKAQHANGDSNNKQQELNSTDKADKNTEAETIADNNAQSLADKDKSNNKQINTTDKVKKAESVKLTNTAAPTNKSTTTDKNEPVKNIASKDTKIAPVALHKTSIKNSLVPYNAKAKASGINTSNTASIPEHQLKNNKQKSGRNNLSSVVGDDLSNNTTIAHNTPNKNKNKNSKGGKGNQTNNNVPVSANGNADNSHDNIVTQSDAIANTNDLATTSVINKSKDNTTTIEPATQDSSSVSTTITKTIAPVADTTAVVAKKENTPKKKNKSTREKAILVGLVAGVDYSTVKFTHGENAGYNIGLMGGYQFSKHWSVSTGAIYTKKNYKLNGSDYHPPKHYWTQYVDLQMVDGYCRMWEIPVQVRYTFNPAARTPFFAKAGLSSYFMTKQAYDYTYKDTWGQVSAAAWSTDSTFNHVFSILHLSAGFEKRIGKQMNLQIEPYAKIPLGGVGFGNIRLSSFGINFSVQYRHPAKR